MIPETWNVHITRGVVFDVLKSVSVVKYRKQVALIPHPESLGMRE